MAGSSKNKNASKEDRKALRAEKKQKKLMAEYQLSRSNDAVKRPGELLDSVQVKKVRVEPKEGEKLSPTEFKELKKQLSERKKILSQIPRFHLQNAGVLASLFTPHDARHPLLMTDIQQLLLYAVCGNNVINSPNRWCNIQKSNRLTHVVTLIVEGVTSFDFQTNEHLFPKLTEHFKNRVEVMAPVYYGSNVIQNMACIPLSETQKKKILQKCGTLEAAVTSKEVFKVFRSVFPVTCESDADFDTSFPPLNIDIPLADKFPRTSLLLSLSQLFTEGFCLPMEPLMSSRYADYKFSKKRYKEVNEHSPMFAVDCEMCATEAEPHELTRVSVVNENLEVVYESLVKPKAKITNYLTKWSGITEEMLQDVTTTLRQVRKKLKKLLPDDAILVGHSLNCDLQALKLFHPYVIDTSVIFNLSGFRGQKPKLSNLASTFLNEAIQQGDGHNPTEDAMATMKLVKLKLSQGYRFGDASFGTEIGTTPDHIVGCSLFSETTRSNKSVAVVGNMEVLSAYKDISPSKDEASITSFYPMLTSSNEDAISNLKDAAVGHNFAFGHIDLSLFPTSKKDNSTVTSTYEDSTYSQLDDWCDEIFKYVSVNGLCVILFAGPKSIPISITKNRKSKHSTVLDSDTNESSSASEVSQPNEETKVPRQNGVCFIRVNTLR